MMAPWRRYLVVLLVAFGINLCWLAGGASAQSPAPNLLVVVDRNLKEYSLAGVLLRTVPITADPLGDASWARDVVMDDLGRIHVYDGTFNPSLNTLSPASGTWSPRKHPGWSTVNNVSFGGVTAYGNYVFATDMWTAGNSDPNARGLIRFDLSTNTATRFSPTLDYIDVNLGLDGLLYGVSDEYSLQVFNPTTLTLIRSVHLGADVRAVAVDANGDIYGASWGFRVHKFTSTGTVVQSLDTQGNSTIDIDIDLSGRIVYGSRDGRVYVTNRQLATPTSFDSSPNNFGEGFVAFAKPTPVPTSLTATPAGTTRVNLVWQDNSATETGFLVERRSGAQAFGLIANVAPNVTTYQDTALTPDTVYTYRVQAALPEGPTAYSNEASARTLPLAPNPPVSLTAEGINFFEIELNWQDRSTTETSFEIERKNGSMPFQTIATVPANVTRYVNTGLPPATQYTYRVRALTSTSETAYTNEATAATRAALKLPPDSLTVAPASSTRIDLRWADRSDTETAFEIERSTGGGFVLVGTVGPNVVRFGDTGLMPQTAYTYRVRARFTDGPSAYSNQASAQTFPPGVFPPENLSAVPASASKIQLTWSDLSSSETGFEVERSEGSLEFARIQTTAPNTTTFADTGLEPDTLYTYRVRAATGAGPTAYSNEAAASTPTLQLEVPTALGATAATYSQINLTWNDTSTLETAFEIERQIGNGAFAFVASVAASNTSYSDPGLLPETTYGYRVRATRGVYRSPYSNVATTTTPPKPLVPPSGFTAGAVSSTEVRLAWRDETDNETGFEIERKLSGGAFAPLATVGAASGLGSTLRYTDTAGLQASLTYVYRIRSVGAAGFSGYSAEALVTTTAPPPVAPTSLIVSLTGPTATQLTWNDASNNETGFSIERKPLNGNFTYIGSTAADTAAFPDAGLAPDTVFVYRIRALGNGGNSPYSNEATTATLVTPPTNVGVTAAGPGQLRVMWTNASQSVTGFKVERKEANGGFIRIASVDNDVTQVVDSGLAAGTTYTYRVRATNPGGNSNPSSEASRITLPAVPSALTVNPVTSTVLQLTWTDGNPSPPAVKVERATAANGPFIQVGTSAGGTTLFQDSALSPNTGYYYRVRATNASGDSDFSSIAFGTTYPTPPGAPSSLTATALSGRSVQLTWQDNSSTETGFEVTRLSPQGGGYQLIATTGANVTGYLDAAGLIGNSSYSYRVRAVNGGGGSSYGNTATVTTLPDLPAAPSGLAAQASSHHQVQLTWTDASDNETSFRIERKPDGGSYQTVSTTAANATEFTDSGLAESSRYTYRVVAVNVQGASSPSAEVSVTTRPQSPGNLTATAGNRRVDLTWLDRSAGETGFRVERHAGNGSFVAIHTAAAGATSYADTTLAAGRTYTYRVFALSTSGDSVPSNESSAAPRNETPLAKLVIAPKALKFGTVKLGRTKQLTLKLTNKGKETVTGTVGTGTEPFELLSGGGAFTLAPKASRSVVVRFAPGAAAAASAQLRITSTDPKAALVNVPLSGRGK